MSFSVSHVSYRYKADQEAVLNQVSFEIKPGEVTAIVGPSGCGKSTLVSILSGVIPDLMPHGVLEGSLQVDTSMLISVVSQSPENQLFGYGVEDAIVFGIENMGLDSEIIAERVEYVLDLLNIQHLRKRSVATLSGGQRQAVCIASVLAMQPDILIMDEPVSSLDPNGKKMIQSVLGMLKQTGQTTVIVDNNLDWFSGIVEHVIGLIDGEVVFDGSKQEFFEQDDLHQRLCVTIPQEVEIRIALSKLFPDLSPFTTVQEAAGSIQSLTGLEKDWSSQSLTGAIAAPQADEAANPDGDAAGDDMSGQAEIILAAQGLSKTFRDGFNALIDVDATFAKGQIISILGQNGSGKTTLVKHLNGLYRPSKGTITYRGQQTAGKSVAQISKDIILVFQNPELMLFEETVLAELTFCARAQHVAFSEQEALAILEQFDLLDQQDTFPINLSMGQKHLLTILSVLFSSAEVVILDEPTLGMDLHQKEQLKDIIAQLKSRGKTVIVISHEIPLVFEISDEILVLNNGRKQSQGPKQMLARQAELFESINIDLPPVVRLSHLLGMKPACCDVASFVACIAKMVEQAKLGDGPVAGGDVHG